MRKLAVSLALGAASVLSLGAALVPVTAQAQQAQLYINVAPPPPRHEVVPPPRHGYVWAPGHYEARKGHYVWREGKWLRAREGYAYRAPEWQENGGRYVYREGGWDRDHDGVPNKYDRRPDNPHRS
ncbi:YXWGXW repeat-containing protein [Variovorax sp. J22R133]|uniref:YXWGXW repeat-containing protein n=1 Tax=Variovorax brevis TaxID=3053503 RepID=UPI0025782E44|nr:YXWGXW repeat-containing protein [Variovorax sp. J22R133]MDM0115877.1 YXWGXW repeat-containing protein [Variovorax sp. J22R133]